MFNKDKVKDVAKLAMIEIDDHDINFYSKEIINFLLGLTGNNGGTALV